MLSQLFEMHLDNGKAFGTYQFVDFKQMTKCRHKQIYMKWNLDMNGSSKVLAFTVSSQILHAKHCESSNLREAWYTIVADVKLECTSN
jgi:hypothetical protein